MVLSYPPDPISLASEGEARQLLRQAIAGVTDLYQPVLRMLLEEGLAPADIARRLGRPQATVRTQVARGLDTLRKALPAGLAAAAKGASIGRGLPAFRDGVLATARESGGHVASSVSGVGSGAAVRIAAIGLGVGLASLALWSLVGENSGLGEFEVLAESEAQAAEESGSVVVAARGHVPKLVPLQPGTIEVEVESADFSVNVLWDVEGSLLTGYFDSTDENYFRSIDVSLKPGAISEFHVVGPGSYSFTADGRTGHIRVEQEG